MREGVRGKLEWRTFIEKVWREKGSDSCGYPCGWLVNPIPSAEFPNPTPPFQIRCRDTIMYICLSID
jgi:hypothetical protein